MIINLMGIKFNVRIGLITSHDEINEAVSNEKKKVVDQISKWEKKISEIQSCSHQFNTPTRTKLIMFNGDYTFEYKKTCSLCSMNIKSTQSYEFPEPDGYCNSVRKQISHLL